jgi:hypothetical protein
LLYFSAVAPECFLQTKDIYKHMKQSAAAIRFNAFLFSAWIICMSVAGTHSAKKNDEAIDVLPPETAENYRLDTVDGVIFTTATDKKIYSAGDSLRVRYRINNRSMATVLYDFKTSCQFELQILGAKGDTVFSLPAPKDCTPEASQLKLAPSGEMFTEFAAVPLALKGNDTLTVKAQMAGYPLSGVQVKAIYRATSAQTAPLALEGIRSYKPTLEFNSETKMLIITVHRAQRLTVSAFILTGQKFNKFSCEKFLAAGTHQISFNNRKLAAGVVIFKVEGNGFSETKTINLAR